jgi:hypothetical protein
VTRANVAWIAICLAGCTGGTGGSSREPPVSTSKPAGSSKPASTSTEEAPASGATSPAGDKHPGKILYEDLVEKRTWTRSAEEVPPSIAWVKDVKGWRPVVKIRITGAGNRREITKYGRDGMFLEVTSTQVGPPEQP